MRSKDGRTISISIHALREEGDIAQEVTSVYNIKFLSTPSARRATGGTTSTERTPINFYPRPPRGGRPIGLRPVSGLFKFLSTPSARRATGGLAAFNL